MAMLPWRWLRTPGARASMMCSAGAALPACSAASAFALSISINVAGRSIPAIWPLTELIFRSARDPSWNFQTLARTAPRSPSPVPALWLRPAIVAWKPTALTGAPIRSCLPEATQHPIAATAISGLPTLWRPPAPWQWSVRPGLN